MKQKYSKPMVYIERFELLDHISRGCNYAGAVVNQQKPESCSYAVDNLALFQNAGNGCLNQNYFPEMGDTWDTYISGVVGNPDCYNALSDGRFFAS